MFLPPGKYLKMADYGNLLQNRKAYHFGHCLSTKRHPEIVDFDAAGVVGGIIYNGRKPGRIKCRDCPNFERQTIKTICFPLYSILMALGNPTVHYLRYDLGMLRVITRPVRPDP